MTATSVRMELRVRGTELGPGYVVHASHFARFCEHVRWQVFEAPDFVLAGKIAGGVVRAQTIEIDDELRYGESVLVTTWLARVGRTSFDFGHRIERPDGARVAAARCTIVHLGPEGPAPLDPALADAVLDAPSPAHEPLEGPLAGEVFEHPFVVRPSDTDAFSHVNQARYVDFAEDARLLAQRAGHPAGAEGRLCRVAVEYLRETRAGDAVVARLAVAGDRERRMDLVRGGELLTRTSARYG